MQLLVIRHAIAEAREEFAASGGHDDDRPLTAFGKRRMRRNALGLRRVARHIEVLASSPLVRAQQTARIVGDAFRLDEVATVEGLRPDRHPRETLTWLAAQPSDATVAVVGHDPHLGMLVSWSVVGVATPAVELRKGGVALVEFERKPAGGKGRLLWLLTPAQLRALAD